MKSFAEAVEALLASYETSGGINHSSGANLPSREGIAAIVRDLERIIFPGYRREDGIDDTNIGFVSGELVLKTARELVSEISKSLDYAYRLEGKKGCPGACHIEARNKVLNFFEALPGIRAILMKDVEAAFKGDPAAKSIDEVILSYPGIEAITIHRIAHHFWEAGVLLIPRIMNEYVHGRTGIDIHPGATIGESFFIDHGTGVVIGETSLIGKNVKVYQGVTLGALSVRKELGSVKRHPTIEDDVTIYSGATILGGETVIGRGAVIGGNVWLTTSVPALSKVYLPDPELLVKKASN